MVVEGHQAMIAAVKRFPMATKGMESSSGPALQGALGEQKPAAAQATKT